MRRSLILLGVLATAIGFSPFAPSPADATLVVSVSLDPEWGEPGWPFRAYVTAGPYEEVQLSWDGLPVATATTDVHGQVVVPLTVPTDAESGEHEVSAYPTARPGIRAVEWFHVSHFDSDPEPEGDHCCDGDNREEGEEGDDGEDETPDQAPPSSSTTTAVPPRSPDVGDRAHETEASDEGGSGSSSGDDDSAAASGEDRGSSVGAGEQTSTVSGDSDSVSGATRPVVDVPESQPLHPIAEERSALKGVLGVLAVLVIAAGGYGTLVAGSGRRLRERLAGRH